MPKPQDIEKLGGSIAKDLGEGGGAHFYFGY